MKNVRYEKREFVRNNTTKKIVEMEWAQNFYHLLPFSRMENIAVA